MNKVVEITEIVLIITGVVTFVIFIYFEKVRK